MKRIKALLFAAIMPVLTLVSNNTPATAQAETPAPDYGKMEISLLTCAPGQEVYSLYGHTAIQVDFNVDGSAQTSAFGLSPKIINYGIFSFSKPFFVLRFVSGLTDYEMGVADEYPFYEEYRADGRTIMRQTLNLTPSEKESVWKALTLNFLPENRVYRYNYFYDNCTTRARDILVSNINGNVIYAGTNNSYSSYRELIHSMNADYPWARFGNDILLGVNADKKTSVAEQQFLPFNLMHDFDKAVITDKDGNTRPLVKSKEVAVDTTPVIKASSFPLTPNMCAWILLAAVTAATIAELRLRLNLWLLDTALLLTTGCAGIILFMMIFSQHPTTSLNLQLLLLNPLPLLFMRRLIKRMRRGSADRLWLYAAALTCLFFIGGIFQTYAEGMYIVAVALLVRYLRRLRPLAQTKETRR